jgi:hypothetical protein
MRVRTSRARSPRCSGGRFHDRPYRTHARHPLSHLDHCQAPFFPFLKRVRRGIGPEGAKTQFRASENKMANKPALGNPLPRPVDNKPPP